jgi:hypothetical protein
MHDVHMIVKLFGKAGNQMVEKAPAPLRLGVVGLTDILQLGGKICR